MIAEWLTHLRAERQFIRYVWRIAGGGIRLPYTRQILACGIPHAFIAYRSAIYPGKRHTMPTYAFLNVCGKDSIEAAPQRRDVLCLRSNVIFDTLSYKHPIL